MPVAQKLPSTTWPDGSTFVVQGTIAEDATAGTHICTVTITPGVGNEFEILYGHIVVGNTATAQAVQVRITDGTNVLAFPLSGVSGTTANLDYSFPQTGTASVNGNAFTPGPMLVSGTMALVLQASTAAVSVTQTFAVVLRLRSPKKPTVTFLDTIGTSTNTVNTNAIFG